MEIMSENAKMRPLTRAALTPNGDEGPADEGACGVSALHVHMVHRHVREQQTDDSHALDAAEYSDSGVDTSTASKFEGMRDLYRWLKLVVGMFESSFHMAWALLAVVSGVDVSASSTSPAELSPLLIDSSHSTAPWSEPTSSSMAAPPELCPAA